MKHYKAGTKIKLWCSCNHMISDESTEIVLDRDHDEYELDSLAAEFKEEIISPSWGFEVVEDE